MEIKLTKEQIKKCLFGALLKSNWLPNFGHELIIPHDVQLEISEDQIIKEKPDDQSMKLYLHPYERFEGPVFVANETDGVIEVQIKWANTNKEKTNAEKWLDVLLKIHSEHEKAFGPAFLSGYFDSIGLNADAAYKEVCL